MMKVDNKVEPISTIDTESKTKVFTSRPKCQINQKNEISQVHEENGISSLHYFSWLSDIFLSIASTGIWTVIPQHNMLEEPSYW